MDEGGQRRRGVLPQGLQVRIGRDVLLDVSIFFFFLNSVKERKKER